MKSAVHTERRLLFPRQTFKKDPVHHSQRLAVPEQKPMAHNIRKERRFEIRCPVTVRLSNGRNHETEIPGMLYDIGVGGAKLELEQPLARGTKIAVLVHFRSPDKQITTVRFEGIVEHLKKEPRFEVDVDFRGTGRYLQSQLCELHATKVSSTNLAG